MEGPPIFETITSILMANPELAVDFHSVLKENTFPKHHVLHHSGTVCNSFFILREGISRSYSREDFDNN